MPQFKKKMEFLLLRTSRQAEYKTNCSHLWSWPVCPQKCSGQGWVLGNKKARESSFLFLFFFMRQESKSSFQHFLLYGTLRKRSHIDKWTIWRRCSYSRWMPMEQDCLENWAAPGTHPWGTREPKSSFLNKVTTKALPPLKSFSPMGWSVPERESCGKVGIPWLH